MSTSRSSVAVAVAVAALVLAGAVPRSVAALPTPAPARSTTVTAADRSAMLRAMRARFGKPITQRFAVSPSLIPSTGWTTVHGAQELSAVKAAVDYQRKCDAADPAAPARIDRVRGPFAPGAAIQINGDCFGKTAGSITLSVGPSPVRLAVQSWSPTAIAATVPGITNARRQTAVLAVVRAAGAALYAKDTASAVARSAAAGAAAHAATATASASRSPQNSVLAGTPVAPNPAKISATGSAASAALAPLPSNEAVVDFWPELERRTLGADAIVNQHCAFPVCLNVTDQQGPWGICTAPCADHEAQSHTASGTRPDSYHWFHSGDDAWLLRHPAGWQVERVDFSEPVGTVTAGQPQDLGSGRTLLPVHWQDIHNVYEDNETGLWFFASYGFAVTMVGPKGTWPG